MLEPVNSFDEVARYVFYEDKIYMETKDKIRSIVQCYGMKNRLNEDIEVRNFIEEYAKKRNLIIDTEIYVTN